MIDRKEGLLAHTSWGAIFAGAIIALATQFMFSLLGAGIGLVSADDGFNFSALGWGTLIWFLITFFVSLFIGGYAASRLSTNIHKFAGVWNSAVVWALVVGLNFAIAGTGISKLSQGFANTVGAVTNTVDVGLPSGIANLDFQQVQKQVDQFLAETENEELKSLVKNEYQDIKSAAKQAATDIAQNPNQISEVMDQFANKAQQSLQEINQSLEKEDLVQTLTETTDMSEAEAQKAVDRWRSKLSDWSQNLQANLQQAQDQVKRQAQQAVQQTGQVSLYAFFVLLVGMFAALIGGRLGTRKTMKDL